MAKIKKEEVVEEIMDEEVVDEVNIVEEEYGSVFNSDGEELLFPEGPTLNKIEEWKSRYKDIYFTEFDEDVFIWHCLSRKEYKDIMKVQGADSYYKEERVCEKCIIWPVSYNFSNMASGKAGIPTFLSEQIMDKSGFSARASAIKL